MIEKYLTGSIGESLERTRQLRQIVQKRYPREYDGLRQICLTRLDETQLSLQRLADETIVYPELQTPRRIRVLKRIAKRLNAVEGVGVFALSRTSPDDDFLNQKITDICNEIAFPLISPTISHISQDYFHIYPGFNLLCLPLIESRFLLHLPDIYHELCHLFHQDQNVDLPSLRPYQIAYKRSMFEKVEHFRNEITAAERVRKPRGNIHQLRLWDTFWTIYWMQEFFCDLFGVLTTGPAFVWSHYHLCVKRGDDPFETPLINEPKPAFEQTHPADGARMQVMLSMLAASGFDREAKRIDTEWRDFVEIMGYDIEPEYRQCYPEELLSKIVFATKEGIEGIGVVTAKPDALAPFAGLLNSAWMEFWRAPEDYQGWEAGKHAELRSSSHADS